MTVRSQTVPAARKVALTQRDREAHAVALRERDRELALSYLRRTGNDDVALVLGLEKPKSRRKIYDE